MAIKACNQISIVDVTDAYSVILTSEAYTFVGDTTGAIDGSACTTDVVAYCGSNKCEVTVGTITNPTGISSTISNNGSTSVTVTFTVVDPFSSSCEALIPVTVDNNVTITKRFSFAVAMTGATGAKGDKGDTGDSGTGISGTLAYYMTTSSSTAPSLNSAEWTTESSSNAPTASKPYLWFKQVITYTDNSTYTTGPTLIGTYSTDGSDGRSLSDVTTYYLVTASSSGVTVSNVPSDSDGWSTTPPATTSSKRFLWMYQEFTYTNPTSSETSEPCIIGTHGEPGEAGADAITMSITSSNGTVFKNSDGSTVLTAHVYEAGTECDVSSTGVATNASGTTLGTVKWYKGTSTSGTASKTVSVSASDVTDVLLYSCQLEA